MEETPDDPVFTYFAQITGIEMDGNDFEQILPLIRGARKNGQWVVLAGHEIAQSGVQTTRSPFLLLTLRTLRINYGSHLLVQWQLTLNSTGNKLLFYSGTINHDVKQCCYPAAIVCFTPSS